MQPFVDPAGRPYMKCAKCRVAVVLPPERIASLESKFATVVRQDSVQAMRFAEAEFSLCARESKVLVLHVTREPGKCHRCSKPVHGRESVCSCRSVNLDW
jgi:hypothetical protein